ncbi:Carotenoid cleavage dioxygenase 8 protein [Thalictrum thalictroides]|uniref:Carotenoid cleavage dioxygenase 8 protein n=1 Tax=Thalictrum thalictroides TaxID=46969 RepID=A0A7J6WXF4_THATH|nr:Carotenoid cleavage dioxygenase 8 protein [Thalictrum thalictroides]
MFFISAPHSLTLSPVLGPVDMASSVFAASGSVIFGSNLTHSKNTGRAEDVFPFKKSVFTANQSKRDVTVTNVAIRPPATMPITEISEKENKLAAWTSVRQEKWEGELDVEGEIPLWLNGTYLRNDPGQWHIGDHTFGHLFDGYATEFNNGRSRGAHRQYKEAMKNKKLCYREFSEDPKPENFLSFVGGLASLFSGASLTDNANTCVMLLGDGLVVCIT